METRPPNIEGVGEVSLRDLVRNALRMRPDRIIVGEVRGPEAFDMLQAMNTGHDGSMSTIHANSPRDALYRVENMVMMANLNIPLRAIRMHIASAVNRVVHVERMWDGVRRVHSVAEVAGLEGDIITTRELFAFHYRGERQSGQIEGTFESSRRRPDFMARAARFGLDKELLDAVGISGAEHARRSPACGCCVSGPIRGGPLMGVAHGAPPRRFQGSAQRNNDGAGSRRRCADRFSSQTLFAAQPVADQARRETRISLCGGRQ